MSLEKQTAHLLEVVNSLQTMDLPEDRKFVNRENLEWMKRNLGIKNSDHDHFTRTMKLIDELLSA